MLIREMREGGEWKIYPRGLGTSHQSFRKSGGAFIAPGVQARSQETLRAGF